MTEKPLYILDSYALIYRAYFAFISRPLINNNGENVSAVYGFFRNIVTLLKKYECQNIVAAFDPKTPTFRHKMYDQYKATRDKAPDDLHAQIPVIAEILDALGVKVLEHENYEADDVIATLAKACEDAKQECRILSGDKDLMQLVTDSTLMMKSDKAGGWMTVDRDGVIEEWGVGPELMLDLLSLVGDTADNIPGVLGIGKKGAAKLLLEYGNLDGIYENIDSIKGATGKKLADGKEMAYFSRDLVRLAYDVPVETNLENFVLCPNFEKAADLLKKHGLDNLAKEFYAAAGVEKAQSSNDEEGSQKEVTTSSRNVASKPYEETEFLEATQNSGNYSLIRTEKELSNLIDCVLEKKIAGFDTETDGLDTLSANLVGFSLSVTKGEAFYVPLLTTDMLLAGDMVSKKVALDQLSRIFYNDDVKLVMHNGKFDLKVLMSNGLTGNEDFPTCTIYDTMIAAWLLQPERDSFKLETLAEKKLGRKGIEYKDIVPKNATFLDVPLETACDYAAEDADFTLQLWHFFEPLLVQGGVDNLFYDLETPILPILTQMEIEGIRIEKQTLADYSVELEKNIAEIEKEIYEIVGHEFNIASPKQLQEVLFTELKLPTGKKTKTGYSTDTNVLQDLVSLHPVPKKILDYRGMAKLKSTYVDALPLLADKNSRIHTSFIQNGTATGRLSSRDPNLQNIPIRDEAGRKIRSAFVAPAGRMLVTADYSQIELVILAHLSQDKNLCKSFIEGTDVHKATASLIFHVEPDSVTADQRRVAKTINFGVMYGMSAFRLSNELGITRTVASQFIEQYFTTYSGIQQFMHTTIQSCEEKGYVETIKNRRRYIPTIASRNKMEKSGAERIAINTPIQGSAADIVKIAMLAVHKALKEEVPSAKLLLQVHDELIAECDEKDAQTVADLFAREMEKAVTLSIPLRVSVEKAKSWGDFH